MRFLKLIGAASAPLAIAAMAMLGSGCGSSKDCSVAAEKQFILETAQDWYLFLPLPAVNPDDYATASDYLDALTADARAQNEDRYFSYVTTKTAEDQFFTAGKAIIFGIGNLLRPGSDSQHFRLFISRVEPNSPAKTAGFVRGDEITAIDDVQISSLSGSPDEVQALISVLFGPSQAGITRTFAVTPVGGGGTQTRSVTKQEVTLAPVPLHTVLSGNIGYVVLDTFIDTADAQLHAAFADFQAQGVHDVIVDLRYNGGGLIEVATTLASLLAAQNAGDPMFSYEFNALRAADNDETVPFSSEAEAIAADRIAFITTGGTASASELTINSLDPYASVAIIGDQTYGKPVGQEGFDMPDCDFVLRLIAFRTANAAGNTDYYDGLPNSQFQGDFCPAADDLTHPRGDPAEASTATAISWIDNGTCPAAKAVPERSLVLRAHPLTVLQDNLPGLF